MALIDIYNTRYENSTLLKKTAAAVSKAAQDILNEDPETSNHANRLVWAKVAIVNTIEKTYSMMWYIASNATIAADPENATDNDIQYVVNGSINYFAQ
jgi:hypothetical protein